MNISIKGRFFKDNGSWRVITPLLEYPIICNRPLLCLQELEKALKIEMNDESVSCFFRIDDDGVFYLVTTHTPQLIDYLVSKMFDLNEIKIEPNLDQA